MYPQKKLALKEALIKARKYCAYQERCHQEVKNKLYSFGLYSDEINEAIAVLISENFINEQRFAQQFAGGKFRTKQWGRKKIVYELKKRNITEYCIKSALKEIDEGDYIKTLEALVEKKAMDYATENNFEQRNKIYKHLINKGFEKELLLEIVNDYFEI